MDVQTLMKLDLRAVPLLSADVFSDTLPVDVYALARPFSPRNVSLSALDTMLDEGMKRFAPDPVASDAWLSPRVHSALRLYRSEAAEPGIWLYLATRYPEYIRWRWGRSGPINQARITGPLHRQALARLWWMAELTRNGSDYKPVANAYHNQDTAQWLLEVDAFHNRAAALAFAEYVATSKTVRHSAPDIAKRLNHALTVTPLDILAPDPAPNCDRLDEWITTAPDETLMYGDRLPDGPDDRKMPRAQIDLILQLIERLDSE
jgi:hypothetical protein